MGNCESHLFMQSCGRARARGVCVCGCVIYNNTNPRQDILRLKSLFGWGEAKISPHSFTLSLPQEVFIAHLRIPGGRYSSRPRRENGEHERHVCSPNHHPLLILLFCGRSRETGNVSTREDDFCPGCTGAGGSASSGWVVRADSPEAAAGPGPGSQDESPGSAAHARKRIGTEPGAGLVGAGAAEAGAGAAAELGLGREDSTSWRQRAPGAAVRRGGAASTGAERTGKARRGARAAAATATYSRQWRRRRGRR